MHFDYAKNSLEKSKDNIYEMCRESLTMKSLNPQKKNVKEKKE